MVGWRSTQRWSVSERRQAHETLCADPFHNPQGTLMCKENLNSIQGRMLVQTSPSQAYDTEKIIAHAKLYDQEFKQRGVARDRFCIKIPATGPGVIAMKHLAQEGIPVLGTAVFNLEQAVACSQAGCLSISPYYNRESCPTRTRGCC